MRTLVVMAHYDATGSVAPHVRRHVAALGEVADRLIVVSTAQFTDEAAKKDLESLCELTVRSNVGYDFFSYRAGLAQVEDLHTYDLVLICNDSYIGPVRPFTRILDEMAARPVDYWGLTLSDSPSPHVQSFFMGFRNWVVRSQAFTDFWRTMRPAEGRQDAIDRFELGFSATLASTGFRAGSYFEPTAADRALARRRMLWAGWSNLADLPPGRRIRTRMRLRLTDEWNPMAALADRVLDDGRLPVVKFDTLRYDPYRLGSGRLLRACERRYPEHFEGVRDYLEQTNAMYPDRRPKRRLPAEPPVALRPFVGYGG